MARARATDNLPHLSNLALSACDSKQGVARIAFNDKGDDAYRAAFEDVVRYAVSVPHCLKASSDPGRCVILPGPVAFELDAPAWMVERNLPPPAVKVDDTETRFVYLCHKKGTGSLTPTESQRKQILTSGGVGANHLRVGKIWEIDLRTPSDPTRMLFAELSKAARNSPEMKFPGAWIMGALERGNTIPKYKDALAVFRDRGRDWASFSEASVTIETLRTSVNWYWVVDPKSGDFPNVEAELLFRVPEAWFRNRTEHWTFIRDDIFITRDIVPLEYLVRELRSDNAHDLTLSNELCDSSA